MKSTTLKQSSTTVEDQDKQNYNSKSEELIKRTEVEDSPFIIITTEKGSFGTFGRYKITEDYETPRQVEAVLKKITWNRIIQIMTLINSMLNENRK